MRSFQISLALIKAQRLFLTLLFWPLIGGVIVLLLQTSVSVTYLRFTRNQDEDLKKENLTEGFTFKTLRRIVFGVAEPLSSPLVCHWSIKNNKETPDQESCVLDKLDVVVRTPLPSPNLEEKYVGLFSGATRRIHFCEQCRTDVVIEPKHGDTEARSHFYNVYSLLVYTLAEGLRLKDLNSSLIDFLDQGDKISELSGEILFYLPGLSKPINQKDSNAITILILNITFTLFLGVWLALKAHKRVLDYFAKNNVLVPLVASFGKKDIYQALWIISLMRVMSFLALSLIPLSIIFFAARKYQDATIFPGEPIKLICWIVALLSSLVLSTIIGSTADLKERSYNLSFLYRFSPLALWFAGTVLWLITIFFSGTVFRLIQLTAVALPIVGITPIVIAPVLEIPTYILLANATLSTILAIFIFVRNTRWFGIHIEEL